MNKTQLQIAVENQRVEDAMDNWMASAEGLYNATSEEIELHWQTECNQRGGEQATIAFWLDHNS